MNNYYDTEIRCEKCDRYLGHGIIKDGIITMKCPKCKHVTTYNVKHGKLKKVSKNKVIV